MVNIYAVQKKTKLKILIGYVSLMAEAFKVFSIQKNMGRFNRCECLLLKNKWKVQYYWRH